MNELKDKPKTKNSESQKELDRAETQFDEFAESIKQMTIDRANESSKLEVEPQTKISQVDIEKSKEIYLKPTRTISSKEKFNEKWREEYNFSKEYVYFIAENHEIIGETIDLWTKPFPGMAAEEWKVPTNVPIWGPRYLAEQIKNAKYHRFQMKNTASTGSDHSAQYYGAMCVDTTVQRLDAIPASKKRSIFMGSNTF